MPTVRDLAAALHVSPATVAAAYRSLRLRGLLAGDRRKGTRVVLPREDVPATSVRSRLADGLVDLASGNPDPRLLPRLDGALRAIADSHSLYGDPAELRPLLAFARSEFAADGIAVDRMLLTNGALDAIDRVLREYLRLGDRVVVEDPCYPALLDVLTASGLIADPVALDAEGPQPDSFDGALSRRPAAIIITPRAQNPTGAAISDPRAALLRRLLARHPAPLLIENDPLGPIAGAAAVTLTGGRARWAIIRSVSKFLGPDLRVAVVAGDETTLARVAARQRAGQRWVSRILQQLALALWSDPSGGRQIARAAETYGRRRTALIAALAEEGIRVEAVSGFNVWIPVRHETGVVQRLAQSAWAVAAGEPFRVRSAAGIRVTTSALEPDDGRQFARDLGVALREAAAAPA